MPSVTRSATRKIAQRALLSDEPLKSPQDVPPPPEGIVPFVTDTPETRIKNLRREIEKPSWSPRLKQNLEAVVRYYEDGGRCPLGEEELWCIDGQLYWGIRDRTNPDDFGPGMYRVPDSYIETSKFQQSF